MAPIQRASSVAADLAFALNADPVAASQIKQYIAPWRLRELLELPEEVELLETNRVGDVEHTTKQTRRPFGVALELQRVVEVYTLRQILGAWVRRMFGRVA